jgi:transposase
MDAAQLSAITDVQRLREIVAEKVVELAQRDARIVQHEALIADRDAQIANLDRTIAWKAAKIDQLTREIMRLRRVQFAARSEKMDPQQRALFDEAMAADIAALEDELAQARDGDGQSPAPSAARATPRRRPLPPELPRVETRHEPASCDCATCGAALVPIGAHVSEKLDCEPLKFFVRRDIYPQYACRACETIAAEPVAPSILDRGIAAPGLLAQVVVAKYVDHLPLYRQEAIHARSGIEIGRTTLAEWVGVVGLRLQPLVDALRAEVRTAAVLHADETPVAQLEPSAGKTKRAYLFAYRTASTPNPIVVFDYAGSRSGTHAAAFLADWRGALMVDDYSGYKALFRDGITELGCWAHARRQFVDLHQASGSPIAAEAIARIAALYRIEDEARDLSPEARCQLRQDHARPLLDDIKRWFDTIRPQVLGAAGALAAIDYCLKRWAALTRYVDDGCYPIDNNPIENAIRPIALGRKNWLFAGSHTAGVRAAAIMSLIATAKANGHDPHAWLRDVLTRLPTTLDRDIGELLPHTRKTSDRSLRQRGGDG